jgi:hypothetical protein
MTTSSIVLIVLVAIAAIVLIAAIAWVARNKRNQHRHVVADKIREAAKEETLQVKQREALADEPAAKARAVQAEADVKAAQASGLQQQAAAHRSEAATSRDQLNEEWDRADTMDPYADPKHPSPPTARNTRTIDGLPLTPAPRYLDRGSPPAAPDRSLLICVGNAGSCALSLVELSSPRGEGGQPPRSRCSASVIRQGPQCNSDRGAHESTLPEPTQYGGENNR